MMTKLAADLRFMQLYTHNAHNIIKGDTFFQDHEFLGELYPVYEAAYDSIIERMIGLSEKPDLIHILDIAVTTMKKTKAHEDAKECFKDLMIFEKYICQEVEKMVGEYSEGTKQLLGNIADASEMRQYKLTQRIA